jgi:hypothetical protein
MSIKNAASKKKRASVVKAKTPAQRIVSYTATSPLVFRQTEEQERMLQMIPHAALTKMVAQVGDDHAWHTIACRLNIGQTLAHRHFNIEQENEVRKAMKAIAEVMYRYDRVKKYGILPEEEERIHNALILIDQMQKNTTRRELAAATIEVFRVAAVFPGKKPKTKSVQSIAIS